MRGRVFLFGDDIDTDQLAPGQYMRGGIEMIAAHCLEGVRPDFPTTVVAGDVIVAGDNFGVGSSREQAAEALRHLGLAGVIARSFAGIFYRNAINLGLVALVAPSIRGVDDHDACELDVATATLRLTTKNNDIPLEPMPDNLQALLADGGLVPHLKRLLGAGGAGS